MMESVNTNIETSQNEVENYYRYHSRIYDATRWCFLFGRNEILDMIPELPSQPRILEVGCGTGKNIERLEYHFPDASIIGVDLSGEMLDVANKKLGNSGQIDLYNARYGTDNLDLDPADLILFSYSLTMFGDDTEHIFEQIIRDLKPTGYIAVVDFNTSPFQWFRNWMSANHVDLSGHLLPLLNKYFYPVETEISKAYKGLWSYFLFLGQQGNHKKR
jgi:S-adenosylmethionine-diacylgycerolhomoserine-N-methlytransferase